MRGRAPADLVFDNVREETNRADSERGSRWDTEEDIES